MVSLLQSLLLVAHLLCNAIAAGGPMAAAVLPCPSKVRRRLAGTSTIALVAGLVAGGLSSLIILAGEWPQYASAAGRLPPRAYLMLASEWAFSVVLMIVYYYSWARLGGRRLLHGAIGVVAATNLLYHFPTMMVVLRLLAEQPDRASELLVTREVFLRVLWMPLPIGLTLHFWGLSAVTTGLIVHLLAGIGNGSGGQVGAGLGLAGVLLMFVSGVWCVLYLPASDARRLLSWSDAPGWFFWGGIACGVALAVSLLAGVCAAGQRKWTSATLAAVAAAMMVAATRSL
ncbi:hypothetical protein Pla123a_37940 [Posidoniimonas polymericola]|uniref:Uncharacterized protein n=1 Tax=Posidoniimonas polymericola TaxID=2528002 RepID=A0A5C5YEV1_9BACT|nr:hypothetical protein [Posidoniimonas polymericola]TWT73459.1 hypothetical protein Pla123a_37940 [Posidoniimonas polymericola]